jgi:hypothetical protein
MDSKPGRKTHLEKYLSHNRKWQYFPVVNINGRPKPELVMIDGKPRRGTSGTFYLDWRDNGQRRTRSVGTSPREALDAWQLQSGIFSGESKSRRKSQRPRLLRRRSAPPWTDISPR